MHDRKAGATGFGASMRPRHLFIRATVLVGILLISWGGFVTSINAGLAVPDWPTSFNSLDPFNPWPQWWSVTPILAEHGHRLLGALVGLCTMILAVWTGLRDDRRWMKKLGFTALFLVIFQGVLGGLRVIWISLDLAVFHAAVAQIFFSLLVTLALFTSRTWLEPDADVQVTERAKILQKVAGITVLAIYGQILLGALLRHPGTGIDSLLAALHVGGAFVATGGILASFFYTRWLIPAASTLYRVAGILFGLLMAQVGLGITAYFVTLDESGLTRPSNLQVIVNTSHLVVGALLLATAVVLTLLSGRYAHVMQSPGTPSRTPGNREKRRVAASVH